MGKVLSTFLNGMSGSISRSVDDVVVSFRNMSGGAIPFTGGMSLTGLTEDELYSKVEMLRKASEKYDRLVFAIGAAYETDSVNVRIALYNADERMYADKKLFYEKHPELRREAVKRTD